MKTNTAVRFLRAQTCMQYCMTFMNCKTAENGLFKANLLKVTVSLGQMCRAEVLANSCLLVDGKSYQTCLHIY